MSSDPGEREPRPPRPDLRLPEVSRVHVEDSTFTPVRRNFDTDLPSSNTSVDVIVETTSPIPIRNLGPVLYIGDVPLTEVTPIGENRYRFVAPNREDLQDGAHISLGWSGSPAAERVGTDQLLTLPQP